ncbi:methyltransferase family protein [Aureispira anguillae]|uniref:Isoprenylcysteine carboxylmethyltransferase family protein n=1 Tax=Aureispira anguillae TaxID=2864201 RepID=A0A916DRN7_9BACT|nr:isoprenylcysteine carboxylmethyltransferase family protein [Aureispira anguillae]BDS11376.1 isoprenylcysteine carboxylmethyltransferase family protein [Aureispira anguillae]
MKRVIPPFLFVLCILLMIGLNFLSPTPKLLKPPINYFGILLLLLGLVMTAKVRKLFDDVDTEIHTFKKPKKLVTDGLFKISRNPIYLGFSISLIGVWMLLGNQTSIIGIFLFILISNFWYIPHEENRMEKEFGIDYKKYKSKVRRWI